MMVISSALSGGSILALKGVRSLLYLRRVRRCRIQGEYPEHYESLVAAILRNVGEGRDTGCQVAVMKDNELIVNIAADCGGRTTKRSGRVCDLSGDGITTDSLMCVFSSGKVVESLLMTLFDSRGWLRLSTRISSVWPEFAADMSSARADSPLYDKANVRVCDIMAHRAGLSTVDKMSLAEIKVRASLSWWNYSSSWSILHEIYKH